MKDQMPLLDKVTVLISETMGDGTGRDFHTFYEFEDADEIMTGARSLLMDFIGPKLTEEKLRALDRKR